MINCWAEELLRWVMKMTRAARHLWLTVGLQASDLTKHCHFASQVNVSWHYLSSSLSLNNTDLIMKSSVFMCSVMLWLTAVRHHVLLQMLHVILQLSKSLDQTEFQRFKDSKTVRAQRISWKCVSVSGYVIQFWLFNTTALIALNIYLCYSHLQWLFLHVTQLHQ